MFFYCLKSALNSNLIKVTNESTAKYLTDEVFVKTYRDLNQMHLKHILAIPIFSFNSKIKMILIKKDL